MSPVGRRGDGAAAAAAVSVAAAADDGDDVAEVAAAAAVAGAAVDAGVAVAVAESMEHHGVPDASTEATVHGHRVHHEHRDRRAPLCGWPAYCCSNTRSHH